MIRVLHKMPAVTEDDDLANEVDERRSLVAYDEVALKEDFGHQGEKDILQYREEEAEKKLWRNRWLSLGGSFLASGILVQIVYFFPIVGGIPIFTYMGLPNATTFRWTIRPSFSYAGQGMIMGFHTAASMMVGAIVGWGILGPVSEKKGWTNWKVNTVEDDAKTPDKWILWISLAIMLTEAVVGLGIMVVKMIIAYKRSKGEKVHDPAPASQSVPHWLWITGLIVSSGLCVGIVTPLFNIPWYDPLIALLMSLLVSVLAVRALGETDFNPVSGVGKIAQIVLSFVSPGQAVSCLVAGAIAEAGATQAGDLLQDLKTGHLLNASPRAMLIGQAIGSIFSVIFSSGAYALYSHIYVIGQAPLDAPMSKMWLSMSRILMSRTLPSTVIPFCAGFAAFAAIIPIIETIAPHRYHKFTRFLPSCMAFALGMFIDPNITVMRFIGSIIQVLWQKYRPTSHTNYMIVVASGFVLGEGIFSLINMIYKATGVPTITQDPNGGKSSGGGGH